MKKYLATILALVLSCTAHGFVDFVPASEAVEWTNDPRFSFPSAMEAFAAAAVPRSEDILGDWMRVGIALGANVTDSSGGYWPDGKYKVEGYSGTFISLFHFTSSTDGLGREAIAMKARTIGGETGKVHESWGPFTGVLNATGYVVNHERTGAFCAAQWVCRIVQAQSMLLCQAVNKDSRRPCGYRDEIRGYHGLVRMAQ